MKALRFAMILGVSAALPIAAASAQSAAGDKMRTMSTAMPQYGAAAQLRMDMRKLWTDHVVWTRSYIVAELADLPDKQAAAHRLMRNPQDFGMLAAKIYGSRAGEKVTELLREHIWIGMEVIKAAKAGDEAARQRADQRWRGHVVDIAKLLDKAVPGEARQMFVDLLNMHIATTTREVVARVNEDWDEDVRAFDAVYDHSLTMADAFSEGIIRRFPDKFGPTPTATGGRRCC
jgi:hypothetical protein